MKLCEIVLAFHHRPSAMSGMDGASTSSAPCSNASPTSRASHGECRRMLVLAGARSVKASAGAAAPRRAVMVASEFMLENTAYLPGDSDDLFDLLVLP